MLLLLKGISNARKMESNLQFQSVQLDRESTDREKGSCTSTDDDFITEFSSADHSIHTPAPSENSRSSAQRRTRPRSGKRAVEEEAVIEIERQKLDLMQSMGNGHVDWDTTYHFLMSPREPMNTYPENMQMKIPKIIFQETLKDKGTQNSTNLSQMQLFHYKDQRETG
jgi:hypothetical protein